MAFFMFLAIGFGFIGGGAIAYRLSRSMGRRFSVGSSAPSLVEQFAAAGALIGLLPAAFLSVVVGGTLGGSFMSSILGTVGVPIGVAFGMCIVLIAGVVFCAAVLAVLGRAAAYVIHWRATT